MNRRRIIVGLLFALLLLLGLLAACDGSLATPAAELQQIVTQSAPAQKTPLILTATPKPTPVPSAVDEAVANVAQQTNLNQVIFLGLTGEDWLNILVSAFTVLIGFLIASWVVQVLLHRLVKRTATEFDDRFLERINTPVRYLVLILFAQVAFLRLTFWGDNALRLLNALFFFLYLTILFWIAWRLIGFSLDWYREGQEIQTQEQADRIKRALPLVARILYGTLIIVASIIALSHFNVNVTVLIAALGIVGLAFSLAAQDTLNDVINGVLIWMDRPFRIGDRIEIQNENTWGDVVDIGTRTTRIVTPNNVMVVVPNSVIGKNQVVNYTYPSPILRMEVDISFHYDEDLDKVRRVVTEAVRKVERVLPDHPVEALFREYGESWISFRVRWWIDTYVDATVMYDQINSAILEALRAAGIAVAVPRQDLTFKNGGGDAGRLPPPADSAAEGREA